MRDTTIINLKDTIINFVSRHRSITFLIVGILALSSSHLLSTGHIHDIKLTDIGALLLLCVSIIAFLFIDLGSHAGQQPISEMKPGESLAQFVYTITLKHKGTILSMLILGGLAISISAQTIYNSGITLSYENGALNFKTKGLNRTSAFVDAKSSWEKIVDVPKNSKATIYITGKVSVGNIYARSEDYSNFAKKNAGTPAGKKIIDSAEYKNIKNILDIKTTDDETTFWRLMDIYYYFFSHETLEWNITNNETIYNNHKKIYKDNAIITQSIEGTHEKLEALKTKGKKQNELEKNIKNLKRLKLTDPNTQAEDWLRTRADAIKNQSKSTLWPLKDYTGVENDLINTLIDFLPSKDYSKKHHNITDKNTGALVSCLVTGPNPDCKPRASYKNDDSDKYKCDQDPKGTCECKCEAVNNNPYTINSPNDSVTRVFMAINDDDTQRHDNNGFIYLNIETSE